MRAMHWTPTEGYDTSGRDAALGGAQGIQGLRVWGRRGQILLSPKHPFGKREFGCVEVVPLSTSYVVLDFI